MREVTLEKIPVSNKGFKFESLSFAAFDTEPLSWNISMGNSIETEDNLNMVFTNIPRYNGQVLTKGMPIYLSAGVAGTIDMVIREINYSLNTKQSNTSIMLGTRKINLDNTIPGGLTIGADPMTDVVIAVIADRLGINFNELIIDDVPWPESKSVIGGTTNVLEYLKSAMKVGKTKIYRFWIDAFNNFHIHLKNGLSGTPQTIDFHDISDRLVSLDDRVFWSTAEKAVTASPNLKNPKAEPPKEYSLEAKIKGSNVVGGVGVRAQNRVKRVDSSGNKSAKVLKKVYINSQFVKFGLLGIDWYKPHTRVNLKNFPMHELNSTDYVIKSVAISRNNMSGPPTTTVVLETTREDMPTLPKPSSKKTKKKKLEETNLEVPIKAGNIGEVKIR